MTTKTTWGVVALRWRHSLVDGSAAAQTPTLVVWRRWTQTSCLTIV
jgi:hypothetical protein